MGFKSSKTVRWADIQVKRIPSIKQIYKKDSKSKKNLGQEETARRWHHCTYVSWQPHYKNRMMNITSTVFFWKKRPNILPTNFFKMLLKIYWATKLNMAMECVYYLPTKCTATQQNSTKMHCVKSFLSITDSMSLNRLIDSNSNLRDHVITSIYNVFFISPPENDSFRKDFCFAVVFFSFFFSPRNLRAPSADRRKILHDARCCVQFYNPSPKFCESLPKKFLGAKTCKIWPDFGRLRSLAANISGTDEDIQNRWVTRSTAIPPALGETSPVKIGPVTLEI